MKYRLIVSLCFILSFITVGAQSIGEWIVYPTFGLPSTVFDTGKEVYVLGSPSLISYTKADESLIQYSKQDGMSDAGIDRIAYDDSSNRLVVLYKNQNIDILEDGVYHNIPDLKDKVMSGNKTINEIIIQDGKAYLATEFGGLILDLKRKDVLDTYNVEKRGLAFFVLGDYLCLKTEEGLIRCPLSENGYDKSKWILTETGRMDAIVASGADIFFLDQNGIASRLNPDLSVTELFNGNKVTALKSDHGVIYGVQTDGVCLYNIQSNEWSRISNLSGVHDISSSRTGELWISSSRGLQQYVLKSGNWLQVKDAIIPNAPCVEDPYDIDFQDGYLYLVTGGPFRRLNNTPGAISFFKDGNWTNITEEMMQQKHHLDFFNLNDIKASPFEPDRFYVGSHSLGMFEFKGAEFKKLYKKENNEFTSAFDDEGGNHFWVSGLAFDPSGNLWALNSVVSSPLRMKTPDNKWYRYGVNGLGQVGGLYPLLITRKSMQKWFLSYYNTKSLNVYDDNKTPENTADDKNVSYNSLIDQDGTVHTTAEFRCLAEDLEGKIWVGTSIGPLIISNPSQIFQTNSCNRPKIARNDGTGLADYLFDNIPIISIVIDPANRKWIGTSGNGVYLVSSDGLEVVHHFTAENSPLYSNEILSMVADHNTGKIYIGCQGGMLCYQSDAIVGSDDLSGVCVYPNPVRPDFSGSIAITGLKQNTLIKITDINNNLIYQGLSLGGQITWDGRNKRGDRIKSGIYLVYGTADDGKQGMVTKIMVIN